VKRRQLLNHLKNHGCVLHRESSKHPVFRNTKTGKQTTVPRHREIDNITAREICKQPRDPVAMKPMNHARKIPAAVGAAHDGWPQRRAA
jgi:mRNA interferase HicA